MSRNLRWFVALTSVLLLGGCKSKKSQHPAPLPTAAAKSKVSVKDGRGKIISMTQKAQRIVVAGTPMYSEILLDLGARHTIVGVAQSPNNPPSLKKLEIVGRVWPLNLEKVLALKPDLVLGTVDPYRSKLEAAGKVPVLTGGGPSGGISSLKQLYRIIQQIDLLVHHNKKRSKKLLQKVQGHIKAIQHKLPKASPTKVAIVYMHMPQGSRLYLVNHKSPAHELLTMAGGSNVFAKHKGGMSNLEVLIRANPNVILTDPKHVKHILQHRALQRLRAVSKKRVYGIKASQYTSSRLHQVFEKLAKMLHPHAL